MTTLPKRRRWNNLLLLFWYLAAIFYITLSVFGPRSEQTSRLIIALVCIAVATLLELQDNVRLLIALATSPKAPDGIELPFSCPGGSGGPGISTAAATTNKAQR